MAAGQNHRKLRKFLAAFLGLLILRGLDLWITYLYTPDLAGEWNPLVSHLNARWLGMILTQLLLLAIIGVPMFFYCMAEREPISERDLKFNEFVYYFFFRKRRREKGELFSRPQNRRGVLIFNGFVLMWAAIGVSLFAIVHNSLLLMRLAWYERFVFTHAIAYFVTIFVGIAIVTVYGYFVREYLLYRRHSPAVKP
jgi:hypothetical protein